MCGGYTSTENLNIGASEIQMGERGRQDYFTLRGSGRAPEVGKMVLGESGPLSNVKGARLTGYGADEGTAARAGTGGQPA